MSSLPDHDVQIEMLKQAEWQATQALEAIGRLATHLDSAAIDAAIGRLRRLGDATSFLAHPHVQASSEQDRILTDLDIIAPSLDLMSNAI